MSAWEFGLWLAAYAAEPWGDWRTDYAGGIVAATLANINRKPSTSPFSPADFMPRFERQEDPATPQQWIETLSNR